MTNKPVFFNCLIKLEFGNNGFCGGGGEGGVGGGIGFPSLPRISLAHCHRDNKLDTCIVPSPILIMYNDLRLIVSI